MPVSYKQRKGLAAKSRAVATQRRMRRSITSTIQRAYGGNIRRSMVSIPAALRSRGGMATEMKTVDGQPSVYQFTDTGAVGTLISMPIEGSSFYNRIARRTRGVSIEIRGLIQPTNLNTAAVKEQYARAMIVYDRQANGALPTVAAILTNYLNDGTTDTDPTAGVNMDNRDRFLIIRDRKFILPAIGAMGASPASSAVTGTNTDLRDSELNLSEFIKLNGLETQYKASTDGSIGDISTGSFLLLLFSTLDANATAAWEYYASVRYKFFD